LQVYLQQQVYLCLLYLQQQEQLVQLQEQLVLVRLREQLVLVQLRELVQLFQQEQLLVLVLLLLFYHKRSRPLQMRAMRG
jgi:hypothetical protein